MKSSLIKACAKEELRNYDRMQEPTTSTEDADSHAEPIATFFQSELFLD